MWQQQQQNRSHLGAAAPAGAAPAAPAAAAELFQGLNAAQREAVSSEPDNPLLIVAGAGTGKTTTLIRRIMYMVHVENIRPASILCITFTNKAAAEVRERLQRTGVDPRNLTAATFHSFCFGLLRLFHKAVGFAQCPTVWTDADLKRAVSLALRLVNLERGRADLVHWLELEAGAPWKDIFAKVQSDHPDVWSSCTEKAKELEEKQQKKKRKAKQQQAKEGAQQAGRGRKKANKGEPNPGPDTTAADAAGAAGSGSGSPAEAPAGSEEADQAAEGNAAAQRLLYRAELVTLLYDKLAEQSVPAGQVPEKLGAKPKASTVNHELAWIDRVKRAGDYQPGQWTERRQQLFSFYTSILRASNAIDFNDMLCLVADMVKEHRGILKYLQKRYAYMLVDEYQDCSRLQVELLMLLSGGSGRITVVGDDAQSIYKWGRRCGGSHLASWSCSSWLVRREQRAWTGGAGLRFSPGGGALTYLARRDGGRLHGMQLLGTGCRSAWA